MLFVFFNLTSSIGSLRVPPQRNGCQYNLAVNCSHTHAGAERSLEYRYHSLIVVDFVLKLIVATMSINHITVVAISAYMYIVLQWLYITQCYDNGI